MIKSKQQFNKRLLEAICAGKDKRSVPAWVMKENGQSESQIQQDCIKWFSAQYPMLYQEGMLFHIPNEGIRLGRMGSRVKREGVVRGVADLCLCIPRGVYGALYIEMKKPDSYQRPEQKEWQRNAEKHGNCYVVCKSVESFMGIIRNYLQLQAGETIKLI